MVRGGFPIAMTLNKDLNEVKEGAMQHSMGGAFPTKRTAIPFTEKGMLTTSFSKWALGHCSWGSESS